MARLTEEVQAFVVDRLAMYDTPSTVAAAVKEAFGITISRQQAEAYDATRSGKKPSAKWIRRFHATRQQYRERVDDVGIAHRAVRMRRLERMANRAEERGNLPLAAQLLEQAAKEMGESYTNRRILEPANPVAALAATLGVTPEEITGALADMAGA
ncbi:MAG: DUF2280 domain-containing protein [Gemmatimonadaceae bacterium]|nr:DUF2280 domain-containing protein [Gemmatimonadaceae bacterium]